MPKWTVPPMWAGKTVAILATGPSLTPQQATQVRAAKSLHPDRLAAVAVSDAFRLAPWADLLYSADSAWWNVHAQEALKFQGQKVSVAVGLGRHVFRLEQGLPMGFDERPDTLATGGNSGYQAVHLAIHARAARVLLLGFDMTGARGAHFFGSHPAPLRNTIEDSYAKWRERFKALSGRGTEILNCTPGSALDCFPRADLVDVLEHL